jgi:hypothetical protein
MVGGVGIPGAVEESDMGVVDGGEGNKVVLGIAVQFGRVKVPLKEPEAPYTMQLFFSATVSTCPSIIFLHTVIFLSILSVPLLTSKQTE